MRRCALVIAAISLVGPAGPAGSSAQTVQPNKVAVGGEVTVARDCKADTPAILVLDKKPIAAAAKSANPKWIFTVDATVEVKKYAATFRCPAQPVVDVPAGELEVTAAATTPPAVPATPPVGTASDPMVVSVANLSLAAKQPAGALQTASPPPSGPVPAELKDVLEIEVSALDDWLKDPKNTFASLRLFLAGVELKNVVPVRSSRAPAKLQVTLEPESDITKDDKDGVIRKAWVQVLRTADRAADIAVSVGPTGQAPFASTPAARLRLRVYPSYTPWVRAFLVAVVIAILVLAKKTSLLRDANGMDDPPYSLAKHQMAVWFVIVIGSYLYIWLITGFFTSISTTALTLIGISGATGLIAVTMDASKRTAEETARIALKAEHDSLEKTLNDPSTGLQTQLRAAAPGSAVAAELSATLTPKLTRLHELKTLLAAAAPKRAVNRVWYQDLLSDESGISFHRLQMAIWTIVLVMVFIRAVATDILMPDFDATLLGLIGISSGTYLGFKFPEKPA